MATEDNEDRLDIDLNSLVTGDPEAFDASKYDRGDSLEPVSEGDDLTEEEEAAAAEAAAKKAEDDEAAEAEAKAAEDAAAAAKAEQDALEAMTPEEREAAEAKKAEEDEAAKEDAKAAEEAAAAEKAEPPKGKGIFIPKDRFDTVNQRRKDAEARVAELEAAEQARAAGKPAEQGKPAEKESPYNEDWFDAKEREYADLVADGSTDDALALRREIRSAEREVFSAEADARASSRVTESNSEQELRSRVQETSSYLAGLNPVLDDSTDTFSEAEVNKVVAMQRGLMASKDIAPDEALMEAAELLGFAVAVVEETPAAPAKLSKDDLEAKRAERAGLQRKIKDSKAQPPAGGGSNSQSRVDPPVDVSSLTMEEFDSLPETTKQRLRGDTL